MSVAQLQLNRVVRWTEAQLTEIDGTWWAELARVDTRDKKIVESVPICRARQEIAKRLLNAFLKHDCGPDAHNFTTLRVEIVTITPAMACAMIRRNSHNRTCSENKILLYASEIEAGRWRLSNQGVGFDRNGNLVDGQHRLWAIILCGIAVQFQVTYGLDPEAQEVVDTGFQRSAQTVLELNHNEGNAKNKRAIAGSIIELHDGNQIRVSAGRLKAVLDHHREAVEWVCAQASRQWPIGKPNKALMTAMTLAYEKHPEEITELAEQLRSQVGLVEGSGAMAILRHIQYMRGGAGERKDTARAEKFQDGIRRYLRALLAHVRGDSLKKLYATDEGLSYFVPNKRALVPHEES